jgi:hypothetical protein
MPEISFLPEEFYLRRWDDPVLEQLGFPVNSLYTEAVLLAILGPSATFVFDALVPGPRPSPTVPRLTPASWPATSVWAILWPATRP